ncbi:MAG: hypothetical protein CVU46_11575 [Chloroflexi bacterium HGW-Chloroflexi-8]|nr:MAG: hypothetical protein CVU46_11575 [Chloroflexi bacterium HGW-Chloroflexi-8]
MKRIAIPFIILVLLVTVFGTAPSVVQAYSGYPTTSIVSVVKGEDVTIKVYNLPVNIDFKVLIGKYGTLGVGGTQVATFDSLAGGTQTFTFDIPAALKDEAKLAIRLEATEGVKYFAYDWFVNNTAATVTSTPTTTTPTPAPSGYKGYPTSAIVSAVKAEDVTIKFINLPKDTDFKVLIGKYGTKGVGGTQVGTFDSAAGGTQTFTYDIPDALINEARLAIRLEATEGTKYYAYDWWWNNSDPSDDSASEGTSSGSTGSTVPSGYSGYPYFYITAVVKDTTVTVKTYNLPKDTDFKVLMGKYGTAAVGGTLVATTASGTGGSQTFTYDIPAGLKGLDRIAIRMDSTSSPYYAYNWFWNSDAP